MNQIYPTTLVITNNPVLASLYDADPTSVEMMSSCVSPQVASDLINQGVKFQDVVFVDQAGVELLEKMGDVDAWDDEIMPCVIHMASETISPVFVSKIHQSINEKEFHMCGMG